MRKAIGWRKPLFKVGQVVAAARTDGKWRKGQVGKIVGAEFGESSRNRQEWLFEVRGGDDSWHWFFEDELRPLTRKEAGN